MKQKHRQGLHLAYGIVSEIVDATHRVRVTIEDQNIVTKPLPVFCAYSTNRTAYALPAINTPVLAILDGECNEGCVVTCLYNTQNQPVVSDRALVHHQFPNGEVFQFDESTGVLRIEVAKIELICSDKLEIASANPSTLQGEEIVIIGGTDNDDESSGSDTIVTSGQ